MKSSENNTELLYHKTMEIKASQSAVWDALVNPEMTKQYMFGCIPVTDWQVGGELIWRGSVDGVDYVKGEVVRFEPEGNLAFTTFNPHAGYADIEDNYLLGEYVLTHDSGVTTLSITQGDFSKVEGGQKQYDESVSAWEMTLQNLKTLLESQA